MYDKNLWKEVELSEENKKYFECDKTVKYIGPIVDGRIVGRVPEYELYYRTFEGLQDLVHIPEGLPVTGVFDCFIGCNNLNPSFDELEDWLNRTSSGLSDPTVFKNCNSPHFVDVTEKDTAVKLLAKLFNIDSDLVYNKLLAFYGEIQANKANTVETCAYTIFESLNVKAFLEIVELLDVGWVEGWKFTTGTVIRFKSACSSDELPYKASGASKRHIVCTRYSPVRFMSKHVINCFRIPSQFKVTTDDTVLIKMFGRKLIDIVQKTQYNAGTDGVIEVAGDSTIEYNGCAIRASGSLRICGAGTLHVISKSNTQPCIGSETNDSMSYGRWSPSSDEPLNSITIDGVHVICESAVPNFSLGVYGTIQLPEIHYLNGGTLECPETTGERLLIRSGAEDLYGSTKRSELAKYVILNKEKHANLEAYKKQYYPTEEAFECDVPRLIKLLDAEDLDELNTKIVELM